MSVWVPKKKVIKFWFYWYSSSLVPGVEKASAISAVAAGVFVFMAFRVWPVIPEKRDILILKSGRDVWQTLLGDH